MSSAKLWEAVAHAPQVVEQICAHGRIPREKLKFSVPFCNNYDYWDMSYGPRVRLNMQLGELCKTLGGCSSGHTSRRANLSTLPDSS